MEIKLWVWWNDDWARITVNDKVSTRLFRSYSHDEGWSSEEEIYYIEDGFVYCESESDGTDCDGRLTTGSVHRKPAISDPNEWKEHIRYYGDHEEKENRPVILNEWEKVKNKPTYDEYAQMMGY